MYPFRAATRNIAITIKLELINCASTMMNGPPFWCSNLCNLNGPERKSEKEEAMGRDEMRTTWKMIGCCLASLDYATASWPPNKRWPALYFVCKVKQLFSSSIIEEVLQYGWHSKICNTVSLIAIHENSLNSVALGKNNFFRFLDELLASERENLDSLLRICPRAYLLHIVISSR